MASGNSQDLYYQFRWKVNIDQRDDVKEISFLTNAEMKANLIEGETKNLRYFKIVVKMDLPKKFNGGLSAGPSPLTERTTNEPWEWGTYTFSAEQKDAEAFILKASVLMNDLKVG